MRPRTVLRGCVIWIVLLSVCTVQRARVWRSELTLWTDAVQKTAQKPRPWINLGLARERAGDLAGAFYAHQTALALSSQPRLSRYQQRFSNIASRINIARMLAQTGHEPEAERLLDQVIAEVPNMPHARYNRAVLWARTGRCHQAAMEAAVARRLDSDFPVLTCS